jgi:hypothetical protein
MSEASGNWLYYPGTAWIMVALWMVVFGVCLAFGFIGKLAWIVPLEGDPAKYFFFLVLPFAAPSMFYSMRLADRAISEGREKAFLGMPTNVTAEKELCRAARTGDRFARWSIWLRLFSLPMFLVILLCQA